ncbi:serine/threonine-protein phosphatase [bacterium]|nr:serine/threonine-protein phosphatase [bacterium]
MQKAYRAVVTYLDRLLDRLVVFRPSHRSAPLWKTTIAALLLAAFAVRSLYGHVLSVDVFLLPVLLAAALFRNRGMLLIIPVAALAYALGGLLCTGIDNRHLLLNTLGQVVEWVLLCGFGLVTLDRYGTIKRLQARQASDVELARRLQLALMQNRFELGTVTLRGKVNQTLEVGGDFYYFRPFGQKYVVFCLGDVMGKGIAASLLMALVMGFMFEWGKKSPSPAFVLRKLNQRLIQWNQGQSTFVTMFYAVYDEEEERLYFANAGHPAALLLSADGNIKNLEGTGIPLGVMEDAEWGEQQTPVASRERLLMYSDGLLEARNQSGEDYGMERLQASLRATLRLGLEDALNQVESDVRNFCQGRLGDDLAILMMERT